MSDAKMNGDEQPTLDHRPQLAPDVLLDVIRDELAETFNHKQINNGEGFRLDHPTVSVRGTWQGSTLTLQFFVASGSFPASEVITGCIVTLWCRPTNVHVQATIEKVDVQGITPTQVLEVGQVVFEHLEGTSFITEVDIQPRSRQVQKEE